MNGASVAAAPVPASGAEGPRSDLLAITNFLDELSRDLGVQVAPRQLEPAPISEPRVDVQPVAKFAETAPTAEFQAATLAPASSAPPVANAKRSSPADISRLGPLWQWTSLFKRGRRPRVSKDGAGQAREEPASPLVEVPFAPDAQAAFPAHSFPEYSTIGLGRLFGSLDLVTRNSVSGWAQNEADPDIPVGLVVSAGGRVITRTLANRFRADLQKAKIGDGNHGFELMFPELSPLTSYELHVNREVDGVELPGSPKIIPAAKGFDSDMEKGIASILTGLDNAAQLRALEFLIRQADVLLAQRADRETDRAARHHQYLFRRRWGTTAITEADWPAEEALGPRVLVIDDYVPNPGRDAGSLAILSHIRALRGVGFEVTLVAARDMEDRARMDDIQEQAGITVCGLPYYYSVEDVLKRQAGLFDAVYLHRISNARKYLMLVRNYQSKARVVYSVADLHHLRLARQGEVEHLEALLRMSEQVAFEEFTAARQSDAVITHSTFEAGILGRRVPPAKVHVVPWGVTLRRCAVPFAERHGIAVIGHFAHKPNPDSVFWLLRYVMPLVWDKDPSIRCAIVGHGWSDEQLPRRDPRVDVIGPVPELRDILDRVRLTVAPLRFGAGVKGKVLESFAAGIPCVMSQIAAEGIPLPPSLDGLMAATAQAMAETILRFHSDEAANRAAAEAGLEMIARTASEQVIIDAMAKILPLPKAEIISAAS